MGILSRDRDEPGLWERFDYWWWQFGWHPRRRAEVSQFLQRWAVPSLLAAILWRVW